MRFHTWKTTMWDVDNVLTVNISMLIRNTTDEVTRYYTTYLAGDKDGAIFNCKT